jgi:hypothetical protein
MLLSKICWRSSCLSEVKLLVALNARGARLDLRRLLLMLAYGG